MSLTAPFLLPKHTRSKGPSLHRRYPASSVPLPLSDTQMVRRPFRRRSQDATPRPSRASPTDADYLPGMLCSLPRWSDPCCWFCLARSRAGFFRIDSAFPASAPGRHHIGPFGACSSFTRVTACQVARPPFCGLCREVPTRPVSQPSRSPAIESNHQLFEWVLPPLVISPFGAHAVLIGKFYLDSNPLVYGGVGLLVVASLWNALPRRKETAVCPSCTPDTAVQITGVHEKGDVNYEQQTKS